MAVKGDFPECEQCTYFQCKSCDLEEQRGDGPITVIKYIMIVLVGLPVAQYLGLFKVSWGAFMLIWAMPLVALWVLKQTLSAFAAQMTLVCGTMGMYLLLYNIFK